MSTPRLFAVLGNPIHHSLSPQLHTLFGRQTGLDIHYEKHCVEPADFSEHVQRFFAAGGRGLNITLPFKEDAFRLAAGHASERARAAGTANTLWMQDGQLYACNTDGLGLVNDLLRQDVPLKDSKILLIGAGGATRGVMLPLLQAGCRHLHIVNRSEEKAHALSALARTLVNAQVQISSSGFSALEGDWDIVINASSSSLSGQSLPLADSIFRADTFAYDMLYTASGDTPFLQQARQAGVSHTSDGLGMLVYQGAASFRIWNQVQPDPVAALNELRSSLAGAA